MHRLRFGGGTDGREAGVRRSVRRGRVCAQSKLSLRFHQRRMPRSLSGVGDIERADYELAKVAGVVDVCLT